MTVSAWLNFKFPDFPASVCTQAETARKN